MASPVATPGPITRLQLGTRISCERCNTLLVPASYKRHLKTVHKDTSIGKQWKCLLCQKVLQTPSRFLQHEKKHKQSANESRFHALNASMRLILNTTCKTTRERCTWRRKACGFAQKTNVPKIQGLS